MVRPNFIPRTLKGVGGVRLFDIPGVVYPKEILVVKKGMDPCSGKPYREAPSWGITSRDAGEILGCSPSAARAFLHRHKVLFRIVGTEGVSMAIYWHRDTVIELAKIRVPISDKRPPSLLSGKEALDILQVSRSSLQRYQESNLLHPVRVRQISDQGPRLINYYEPDEIRKLARFIALRREKEKEINSFRQQIYSDHDLPS